MARPDDAQHQGDLEAAQDDGGIAMSTIPSQDARAGAREGQRGTPSAHHVRHHPSLYEEAHRFFDYVKGHSPDPGGSAVRLIREHISTTPEAARSSAWIEWTDIVNAAMEVFEHMKFARELILSVIVAEFYRPGSRVSGPFTTFHLDSFTELIEYLSTSVRGFFRNVTLGSH
jgi:hypothetical protein